MQWVHHRPLCLAPAQGHGRLVACVVYQQILIAWLVVRADVAGWKQQTRRVHHRVDALACTEQAAEQDRKNGFEIDSSSSNFSIPILINFIHIFHMPHFKSALMIFE